jgi:hypothetical protein
MSLTREQRHAINNLKRTYVRPGVSPSGFGVGLIAIRDSSNVLVLIPRQELDSVPPSVKELVIDLFDNVHDEPGFTVCPNNLSHDNVLSLFSFVNHANNEHANSRYDQRHNALYSIGNIKRGQEILCDYHTLVSSDSHIWKKDVFKN